MSTEPKPISAFNWKAEPSTLAKDNAFNGINTKKNQNQITSRKDLKQLDESSKIKINYYSRAKQP